MLRQGFGTIDPNATPDTLARKREMIQRLFENTDANYTGSGIAALAQGILGGVKNRRMDKFEGEKRGEATDAYNRLFGGGDAGRVSSRGPMSILGMPPDNSGTDIRAGLIERGMPEHVADGFMMNFQDESGLNPGINEQNPTVPGSRGGFGLAQWTGPRRRALETFAEMRGANVADPNTQLDFLMTELQGPESGAARSILSSQDAGQAGAAIVNNFLRPAEQHRAEREARYTGGQGYQGGSISTSGSPGMSGPGMSELTAMAANPWLSQEQRQMVQSMMGQQQSRDQYTWQQQQEQAAQASDPLRQQQLEMGAIELERLRNEPPPMPGAPTTKTIYDETTGQERVVQWDGAGWQQLGGTAAPSGPQVVVNNNGDPVPEIGTIPQGWEYYIDENGIRRARPVAGGPEDGSAADLTREGNKSNAADVVLRAASRAREADASRWVGGIPGRLASNNPSSQNAEVYRQVESLQSMAKVTNLQAMRDASPTGGALGGISAPELIMLETMSGALDPASPNFQRDLNDYERMLLKAIHGPDEGERIFQATRVPPTPGTPAPASSQVLTYDPETGTFQ